MNLLLLLVALALLVAPRFAAADEGKQLNLQLKPKLLASSSAAAAPAPFAVAQSDDSRPLDLGASAPHRDGNRSACGIESTWCYDATDGGRIVYKPARRLMPHINGLTPENISVKRDRIVFRYSF
jgi:hypothetical protein